jgi:probable HAF family extracellular repeat protein
LDGSSAGWKLNRATAINNLGQVVGYGINPNGLHEAFLLTPTVVPEPSSFAALVGVGVMVFGMAWWKKRRRR